MPRFATADFDFDSYTQQFPERPPGPLSLQKRNELNCLAVTHNEQSFLQTEDARLDPANVPIGDPLRPYYAYTPQELDLLVLSERWCRDYGPLPNYLMVKIGAERTRRGIPIDGHPEQVLFNPNPVKQDQKENRPSPWPSHNGTIQDQDDTSIQCTIKPESSSPKKRPRPPSPVPEVAAQTRTRTKKLRYCLVMESVEIPSVPSRRTRTRTPAVPSTTRYLTPIPFQDDDDDSDYQEGPPSRKRTTLVKPTKKRTRKVAGYSTSPQFMDSCGEQDEDTVEVSPRVETPKIKVKPSSSPAKGETLASRMEYFKHEDIKGFIKAEQTSINANRSQPLRPIPQGIPTGLPQHEELVCASRQTWSDLFGGNLQRTFTPAKPEKRPNPEYRNFMFIKREHNPDAPWYPGGGGLVMRREGTETDLIDRQKYIVVTQNGANKWRLMGLYEARKLEGLSKNEWKGLSNKCKQTWIISTYKKQSEQSLEIKAKIALRKKLGEEPSEEAMQDAIVKQKRQGKGRKEKYFGDVTMKDIEDAFDSGKTHLLVYALHCVEYPVEIQRRIIAATGGSPDPAPIVLVEETPAPLRKRIVKKASTAKVTEGGRHDLDSYDKCSLDEGLDELSDLTDLDEE
ncbi:hypothetical protein Moror_15191 [Moniliophthora roreri MCA 2997]|uniref:DUF6697 domain-containing protein n=1 Tax=Moniliophthora roreri (strain MCA 2997) TaxID=1381753 RepID=V2WYU6_MONRO|nr:hypothetical protein Moror_15191 [Moniliophthora roreri MCA 2997]